MGRKKVEKAEINELKTEEIVSEDINTPVEEENAPVEEGVKIDAENPDVEQAKKEEEKAINKIVFDGVEIPMENAILENESISPEEIIKEAETDVEIVEANEDLINLINGIELILDSNQDVDFDILNLKNQIRRLIAEFK